MIGAALPAVPPGCLIVTVIFVASTAEIFTISVALLPTEKKNREENNGVLGR